MCFKHLPIEFDAHGNAYLKDEGDDDPFAVRRRDTEQALEKIAKGEHIRDVTIDPVTRVAGALTFRAMLDLNTRRIVEAQTHASMFRGYEVILKGRHPMDAIDISSRACGVCGGVHATTASLALEMAAGVPAPPFAVITRNLGEAAELLYDHCLHLFLLAGPDYSEAMVRKTSPSLWAKAETTATMYREVHGLSTIGEIMEGLNPLKGSLYLEALQITRMAREVASLCLGKYPHPSTIFPGGLGIEPSPAVFNDILGRIVQLLDYAKKVAALWEDLVGFWLEAQPEYAHVGERRANLICNGSWDDPESYDATYANCNSWGERRLTTPGVIIDGELRTTGLREINLGMEEFVEHSFYDAWDDYRFKTDPMGAPLSPYHPWNKETRPHPQERSWKDRYSWSTAPRWDREPMESGPIARNWVTAVTQKVQNEFIYPTGSGLIIVLPKGNTPAFEVEWKVPERVNALERNRARAVHVGYCCMVAYTFLLRAFESIRMGRTEIARPVSMPDHGIGVGFWEAGRGYLTHHAVIDNGRLSNYQIITPSTLMASPRDPFGALGPYEEAVLNTPILEEFDSPEEFQGIDILRTIRSFDPCMPCTVHMDTGEVVLYRDATTCACGIEG